MDPFSALTVTCAVVQFVHFGSKIVKVGYAQYCSADGATDTEVNVEGLIEELDAIYTRLPVLNSPEDGDNKDKTQELVNRCREKAEKLRAGLARLRRKQGGRFSGWSALTVAVKSVLSERKVAKLEKELDHIHTRVQTQMLGLLQGDHCRLAITVRDLESKAEKRSINHGAQLTKLRSDVLSAIAKLQTEMDAVHTVLRPSKHNESKACTSLEIEPTISNGNSQQDRIQAAPARPSTGDEQSSYRPASTASSVLKESPEPIDNIVERMVNAVQSLRGGTTTFGRTMYILESLRYEGMPERRRRIREAHRGTLAWMLQNDQTNFPAWLKSQSGLYWVTGKAGSGKSTLMKYLDSNPQVLSMLENWAALDSKRLMVGSFFFWHSGTPMQRSHEGLLRTLLYQVLGQHPDLVPQICPELMKSKSILVHADDIEWSFESLSVAFTRFATIEELKSHKFCFFIDGLDEYEGLPSQLVALLDQVTTSEHIKLCVSSRPWLEFQTAYGQHSDRWVSIHEFTRSDMELFVSDQLRANDRLFEHLVSQQAETQSFVNDIVEKAQGVFLWTFLAVRSLLFGLNKQDDISTLRRRLDELPADLHYFFQRMLNDIEPVYQPTSTLILLTIAAANELPLIFFRYLPLFLCEDDDDRLTLEEALLNHSSTFEAVIRQAQYYINACCRDLLELPLHTSTASWVGNLDILNPAVGFSHRLVKEYLILPDVHASLKGRIKQRHESLPWRVLTQTYVLHLGSQDTRHGLHRDKKSRLGIVNHALQMANMHELVDKTSAWSLMKKLEQTGRAFMGEATGLRWVASGPLDGRINIALIRAGLVLSVRDLAHERSDDFDVRHSQDLLTWLFIAEDGLFKLCTNSLAMTTALLEAGLSLNHVAPANHEQSRSAWQVFLRLARGYSMLPKGLPTSPPKGTLAATYSLAKLFLEHGADPFAAIPSYPPYLKHDNNLTPQNDTYDAYECLYRLCEDKDQELELKKMIIKYQQEQKSSRGMSYRLKTFFRSSLLVKAG